MTRVGRCTSSTTFCHGKGFTGTGYTDQHLLGVPWNDTFAENFNGPGLISGWGKRRFYFKRFSHCRMNYLLFQGISIGTLLRYAQYGSPISLISFFSSSIVPIIMYEVSTILLTSDTSVITPNARTRRIAPLYHGCRTYPRMPSVVNSTLVVFCAASHLLNLLCTKHVL